MSSQSIFESGTGSVYTIDITNVIGPEYIPMMNDIVRFVAIQTILQLLLFTTDACSFPFFSPDFLLLVLFIAIGVMFYHLVLLKIVTFK
jgi:hypothetical protein